MTGQRDSMLVVEKGVPGVKAIPLDQPVCIIGSSATADVSIDNPYVSRTHAQIIFDGERFQLRDMDSKNSTFVNGARIVGEGHVLEVGDRIELAEGEVSLRFASRSMTVALPAASVSESGAEQGEVVVDTRSREVWIQGKKLELQLSRKEFDVLSLLFQRKGEACSKDDIATAGWPERTEGDVGDQEIEQTIRRLRLRIEPGPSQPRYIVTVRGYGYKLSPD